MYTLLKWIYISYIYALKVVNAPREAGVVLLFNALYLVPCLWGHILCLLSNSM